MKDLQIFECSSVNPEKDGIVTIGIERNPKSDNTGSYVNDGKATLPLVNMLIRHGNSGFTFLCIAVNKKADFDHTCTLRLRFKEEKLPKIEPGDLFMSAGFVVNQESYLTKDFKSISVV